VRTLVLLLVVAALAACASGEPTEEELERAVHGQYDAFNLETQRLMGRLAPESQFTVHSMRKIGCTQKAEPGAYRCEVEIDMTMPGAGRITSKTAIELVDEGDAWQVTNVF
jgi:hypothetical protein